MNFDLELFKQALESDTKELDQFRKFLEVCVDGVGDDYLDSMQDKLEDFIEIACEGIGSDANVQLFVKTVLIKYAYLQGLKDATTLKENKDV